MLVGYARVILAARLRLRLRLRLSFAVAAEETLQRRRDSLEAERSRYFADAGCNAPEIFAEINDEIQ